jgi:circadian clock protein KaiC
MWVTGESVHIMPSATTSRLSTGIEGLDEILHGGFVPRRNYLIRGPAGSGKTILGLHFLQAGIGAGETGLFINVEEDLDDLTANADALGFDTAAIDVLDLSPTADVFVEDRTYDVFDAAEVEQEPLREAIVDRVEAIEPTRVVVDPLTQFRYLSTDDYQFRKQVVGLMRFLEQHGATVVFTAQDARNQPTEELEFVADGTIRLATAPYGSTVQVPKFRGSKTQRGDHAYRITDDGMVVYPALVPSDHHSTFTVEPISSGVPEVDELLNGGIQRGTISVVSGPTGVGKTTLGTQFMNEAADRGERSVVYLFEESKATFLARSEAIGIPVERMIDRGTLDVREMNALELSPQEFARIVREDVEKHDAEIVMLDGIAGYRLTLHGETDMVLKRLHALGRYLKNMGVTGILIDETDSPTGPFSATQENISYLADNIVFLRHLELRGELRKAIGVLKKRTSDFERTLREFEITNDGIAVGEPLTGMQGILSGTPELLDADE